MMGDAPDRPVLTAAQVVEWKKRRGLLPRTFAPRRVILCFQSAVIRFARASTRPRRVTGLNGEVYELDGRGTLAVVRSPGPGAPAAVALLEELVALGGEQFIALGLAGALQPTLAAGDLVIAERARRDEGTSLHYLPKEKWALAAPELVSALSAALEAQGHTARRGCTWTTDAPYRETRREVEAYRHAGVDTVEMEAAALYAAGQALQVQVVAGLAVADALDGQRAPLEFDAARAETGLRHLVRAALDTFREGQ